MKPIFNGGAGLEIEDLSTGVTTQSLNGVVDPSISPGVYAPISSHYTRAISNGDGTSTIKFYDKFGPLDTDWKIQSTDNVLGSPNNGNWSDGLFPFAETTPVGSAVDQLNEVLALMVPPPAPTLSVVGSGMQGVTGKLSFDTTHTIAGYGYDANAINTQISPASGINLGIFNGSTSITGTLNYGVAANVNTAWPATAFGPGDQGTLQLWFNGAQIHSVDLSTFASGVTHTNGSGFNLLAATAVKFSNGNSFPALKYRTGALTVASLAQRGGFNTVQVKHVTTAGTTTSSSYYWYNSNDAVAMTGDTFSLTPTMGTSRWLSGVQYYTAGTLNAKATVHKAYADVYSASGSGIVFSSSQASLGVYSIPATTSNAADLAINVNAGISTAIRLLGVPASYSVMVYHPIKTTYTSPAIQSSTLLYDPLTTVTALVEEFNVETYRIPSSASLTSAITTPPAYNSQLNVSTNNELQCYNGTLRYPTGDFRVVAEGGSIVLAPTGNPNYTGSTGSKTFIRSFQNNTGATKANLKLNFAGSSTSFSALGGAGVSVEFKFPTGSLGAGTGWMDAYNDFATGAWSDGAGCRASNQGAGRALATDWGVTVGTQSIAANEWVYVRITAPASWSGYFDSLTLTWL
jgi:hypothetical protein